MTDIFVERTDTSAGVNYRFFKKLNDKEMTLLSYEPYKKISQSEYVVKPDLNTEVRRMPYVSNGLTEYDETKTYINIFRQSENTKSKSLALF